MDLVGEFHKVEIDGKLYLSYQNVTYPLPQICSQKSSLEAAIESGRDLRLQPVFVCPTLRIKSVAQIASVVKAPLTFEAPLPKDEIFCKFEASPFFDHIRYDHHVVPLSWCNNKDADPFHECHACRVPKVSTDYYFCVECDRRYHKECVESPLEIHYPSHVKHSLQLYYSHERSDRCILCTERAGGVVYYCALCDIYMHVLCAQATIPFFIDQPKRHDHTLTLFPRQASLMCNVCGLVNKFHLTYVCPICDFVAHKNCIDIPQTIRISRHHHRISFISSLPLGKWACGVCRIDIVSDYGAYACNICSGYAVHTRCSLRMDIWDGIDLEGVPEENEEVEPFERIAEGIILHFSHGHHLRFETSGVFDGNKFCQACALPVNESGFYLCVECDFILHVTCAEAPRKKIHPLYPHQLKLETVHQDVFFSCTICRRLCSAFAYVCANRYSSFQIDVRCALTLEPFEYQGHQHPLFLALDPREKPKCHVCKSAYVKYVLNCIECDFILCFKCATLPYNPRYKHDEHYLTFCHGDKANDSDWCECCEGKLAIGGKEGFYKCNDCCTTLHINCLLGKEPYMKPGSAIIKDEGQIHVLRNNSPTRPICTSCHRRCPCPILLVCGTTIICSFKCFADNAGAYLVRVTE